MFKKNDESENHLVLHYEVTKTMWDIFFVGIGLSWVMPFRLMDFVASWKDLRDNSPVVAIWRMAPICMCLCNWQERNDRIFKDHERTRDKLKAIFFKNIVLMGRGP